MPILSILAPLITYFFKTVVIKFLVLTAIFGVMALLIPFAIDIIAPKISTTGLSGAFSAIDSGTWFILDFFALDYGLPLILSAYVARFLIRRIPVIG